MIETLSRSLSTGREKKARINSARIGDKKARFKKRISRMHV
jgi:hypothetical protein